MPPDFFQCDYLKCNVYANNPQSLEKLMKKITTVLTTRDILKYNGKITKKACFTVSNNGDHLINIVNIQNLVSINKKAQN